MNPRKLFWPALSCLAVAAMAAPPNFSGTWVLNPAKSHNLGMMAAMQDTVTIEQSAALITVHDDAEMNGSHMQHITRYDLSGKAVANRSPTGEPAQTRSHWQGAELETQWSIAGSIQGTTHERLERRFLSPDGQQLTEVSGASRNDPKSIVMVFDRR